jgi:hypothetical protein
VPEYFKPEPIDKQIGVALAKFIELRTRTQSAGPSASHPCNFIPILTLLEYPWDPRVGFRERMRIRLERLHIFWCYDRQLTRRCRSLTRARLRAVSRGAPLSIEKIASDDRLLRLSLRRMRVAALLYLFGRRESVDLARASCAELMEIFTSPSGA